LKKKKSLKHTKQSEKKRSCSQTPLSPFSFQSPQTKPGRREIDGAVKMNVSAPPFPSLLSLCKNDDKTAMGGDM
jgi:hypothetical protein